MKRLTLSLASGIALVLALLAVGLSQGQYVLQPGLYDDNIPFVTKTGTWTLTSENISWYYNSYASVANFGNGVDTYSFYFFGDEITLIIARVTDGGTADVCIDSSCSSLSFFNSSNQYFQLINYSGLDVGIHFFEIITTGAGLNRVDGFLIECSDCVGGSMDEIVVTVQVEVTAEVIIEMTEEPYVQTWELVDSEENAQIVAFKYQADIGQLATIILLFGILLLVFTNTILNTWRHINHDDD